MSEEFAKKLRDYIKGRYPPHRVLVFGTKQLDENWNKEGEWFNEAAARIEELEKLANEGALHKAALVKFEHLAGEEAQSYQEQLKQQSARIEELENACYLALHNEYKTWGEIKPVLQAALGEQEAEK